MPSEPSVPHEPRDQQEPVGVRIGELSRRVGVSAELLRAWERRYRLLQPARSSKGYRLYTGDDEQRVRSMREQLASGLSAAEAARVARRPQGEALGADAALEHSRALERALDAYDEVGAQQAFDTMFRRLTPITVLRDVVLPYLRRLGERWEDGGIDVAQEHFASNVIRGRLGTLAVGWGDGVGPRAVLACPEGELHDLPLMVFGIALNRSGWRITFLGTNTPVTDLENAVRELHPDIVVLAATTPTSFLTAGPELRRVGRLVPMVVAGAGATLEAVAATGATALHGDPVTEARRLPVPSRTGLVAR
jgi:DNA-binding transcriptional MerR regulator